MFHSFLLLAFVSFTAFAEDCNSENGQVCFQLVNQCPFPIWPGLQGRPSIPEGGGFRLESGEEKNVYVPDHWEAGRVWARTGCNDEMWCETGFCGNSVACEGRGGEPPATLAEFTLGAHGNQDYYDVSNVDGFNIQVKIAPVEGTFEGGWGEYDCKEAGRCFEDMNAACPEELKLWRGEHVAGCKSACLAFNNDEFCCRGAHDRPETCRSSDWSFDFPAVFKRVCPTSYSYAYDDHKSTFTCRGKGTISPVYRITFC